MRIFHQKIGDELVIIHDNKLCKVKVVKTSKGKAVLHVDSDSTYSVVRGKVEIKKLDKDREDFESFENMEKQIDQLAVSHALRRNSENDRTNKARIESTEEDY